MDLLLENHPLIHNHIVVKKSLIHGYGVFAEKDFLPNEVIEECHGVIVPYNSCMQQYYFHINAKTCFIPAGYGFVYNHSDDPNVIYIFDSVKNLLIFSADKKINQGDELFISYGQTWFSKRKMAFKKLTWRNRLRQFLLSSVFRGLLVVGLVYSAIKLLAYL